MPTTPSTTKSARAAATAKCRKNYTPDEKAAQDKKNAENSKRYRLKKKKAEAPEREAKQEAKRKAKEEKMIAAKVATQVKTLKKQMLGKVKVQFLNTLTKATFKAAKDMDKTQASTIASTATTVAKSAKDLLGGNSVSPFASPPAADEVASPASEEPEDDEVEVAPLEVAPLAEELADSGNRKGIGVQLPLTQSHREILVNLDECHAITAIVTKSCQEVLEVYFQGVKEASGLGGVLHQIKGRVPRELMDDLWFIANERNWRVHDRWVYSLSNEIMSEYQRIAVKVLGALCPDWKLVHYNVGLVRYKAQQVQEAREQQAQARSNYKRGWDGDGDVRSGNGSYYGHTKRPRNGEW